jgi:hypothetical protein
MNKGIFIDFDALVLIDSKIWVVDKKNANTPLMKISKTEFNLIKSGVYKNQGNKIDFNGKTFYLPTNLWNNIKIKSKNYNTNLSDIALSLQEFLNKEIIDELDFELNDKLIDHIMNEVVDLYIICSKQVKERYSTMIEKVTQELKLKGLKIKNFYFISENFTNLNEDDVRFKKIRLFLQHLIGYKTEQDHFIDEEITKFEQIHYYDSNSQTLKLTQEINNTLEFLLSRTDDGLRNVIKEDIEDYKPVLWCHKINSNQVNWVENKKVVLNISKIITTFENFNPLI